MPLDTSIALGVKPFQMPDQVNQLARVMQIQGMQQEQGMNQLKMDQARVGIDQQNKLRGLLSGDYATPDDRENAVLKGGFVKEYGELSKQRRDNAKTVADTDKTQVETAGKRIDITGSAAAGLRANPSLENAHATLDYLGQQGVIPAAQVATLKQSLAADPTKVSVVADMMYRSALSAKDQLATMQTRNTGATTDTLAVDPVTQQARVVNSVQNTVSPDAQLSANTSTANNKRTIEAENVRAGVVPGGGLDQNSERTAQAIASGQLPAPTGMALLNPKNQRILGRVMEINPTYDSTTVDAKKKAARDFTTGPLGNSMRSFAVAGQHLDQLGQLVDALDNGNLQMVNKVGNLFASQTGNPAPTNFDAAKDVVSKEVVKAIVAGGGGVSERQELSHLMDNAKTPAQLKGVIQQYRNLMAAQHDALLQQRRSAGLPDSTMPNYTDANGTANSAPGGWTYVGTVKQ